MNAAVPCSLHSIRIRVEDGCKVQLCLPHQDGKVAAIHPGHGTLSGIMTEKGWVLVPHPEKGLMGLPLNGEHHSWWRAWEDAMVQIDVCAPSGWITVEDWDELSSAIQHA